MADPVVDNEFNPYDVLSTWLDSSFDSPQSEVVIARFSNPPTRYLADIGNDYGVSKERIRQMALALTPAVHAAAADTTTPLGHALSAMRRNIGSALPAEHIPLIVPDAARPEHARLRPLLVALVFRGYTRQGDWLIAVDKLDYDPTRQLGRTPSSSAPCGEVDVPTTEVLSDWGLAERLHNPFVERCGVVKRVSFNGLDRWVAWGGPTSDKIERVLCIAGRPITPDALLQAIDGAWKRKHLMNILTTDPRFVRRTSRRWALEQWGLPQYNGIGGLIESALHENGPQAPSSLAVRLSADYEVSASSVKAYCRAPLFVPLPDGRIRLRSKGEPYSYPHTSITEARGVFLIGPARVGLLYSINNDILRGSGQRLPRPAGQVLGIYPGEQVNFRHLDTGLDIATTFPWLSFMGPLLGGLRRLVETLNAKPGDHLTLVLDRESLTAEATATDLSGWTPGWGLVSRLTGVSNMSGLEGLSSAIGCPGEDPDHIVSALLARRDYTLLAASSLLPAASTAQP